MKNLIETILLNQGISLSELSRKIPVPFWTLWQAKNGDKNYLTSKHLQRLHTLATKPSYLLKHTSQFLINMNKKSFLNVSSILPPKSRTGFPVYVQFKKKKMRVWYQPKSRKYAEITLPSYISFDEFFIAGLGLSVGDGLNNPNLRNMHYTFANTNLSLVKHILHWLNHYFQIPEHNLQFYVFIPLGMNAQGELTNISQTLGVNVNRLNFYMKERHRKPSVMIQLSNAVFQCFYLELFDKLKNVIFENDLYRRWFLKGLFAAEGHVKHSEYGTIESLQFSFNPKTEKTLIAFVQQCLKKEGLRSKANKRGAVYLCDYNNMIKLYLLGILDLHKDKKEKFLRLCKNAQLQVHFKPGIVNKLITQSQSKMAEEWNVSQTSISHYNTENRLDFRLAQQFFGKKELLQKMRYLKVHTNILKEREAMRFMTDLLW